MSNITSVKASTQSPSRTVPIIFIVLGVLFLVGGFIPPGLFVGGAGAVWLFVQKTTYHVMLTTAGGETSALNSEQPDYIEKVVKALNEAIVARG